MSGSLDRAVAVDVYLLVGAADRRGDIIIVCVQFVITLTAGLSKFLHTDILLESLIVRGIVLFDFFVLFVPLPCPGHLYSCVVSLGVGICGLSDGIADDITTVVVRPSPRTGKRRSTNLVSLQFNPLRKEYGNALWDSLFGGNQYL